MTEEEIKYTRQCVKEDIHRFYIWGKWKAKRLEVLKMDHYECQDCRAAGKYTRANTVHHNQYVKNHPEAALDIWYTFQGKKYRNLVSLCFECHEKRHEYRRNKLPAAPLTEERWD